MTTQELQIRVARVIAVIEELERALEETRAELDHAPEAVSGLRTAEENLQRAREWARAAWFAITP